MVKKLKFNVIFLFKLIFYTPLKYILLFIIALILVLSYGAGTWWGELIKKGLPLLFSLAIFSIIARDLWKNRSKLDFVGKIYFKSGILSYFRAFGIVVFTITLGALVYLAVPEFLRWGWGSLIFGDSGNVALQPLSTASQVGQKVSEIQGSGFDYRWLFLLPMWSIFILALPFLAEVEEKFFRKGVHSWKGITINSIKFGLIHLIMGIPICWALTLSVPGFLFACRYKYIYHRHFKKFKNEAKAQDAGVVASTADHAIYNAILITLSVALLLSSSA
jgi:membrane protease YdiL (CAAX protease family)